MNAKYFEENGFEDFHGTKFHKAVLDHAACIANNLMFDATHPDNNDGETAANAYHVMIALCEAGLSRIDEKCVAKSREFITDKIKPSQRGRARVRSRVPCRRSRHQIGGNDMINEATIQAQFKQATVKGSVATLQFEILTDNADAFRIIKQSGKTVLLTVAEQQQAMDFDDETGEIYG